MNHYESLFIILFWIMLVGLIVDDTALTEFNVYQYAQSQVVIIMVFHTTKAFLNTVLHENLWWKGEQPLNRLESLLRPGAKYLVLSSVLQIQPQ